MALNSSLLPLLPWTTRHAGSRSHGWARHSASCLLPLAFPSVPAPGSFRAAHTPLTQAAGEEDLLPSPSRSGSLPASVLRVCCANAEPQPHPNARPCRSLLQLPGYPPAGSSWPLSCCGQDAEHGQGQRYRSAGEPLNGTQTRVLESPPGQRHTLRKLLFCLTAYTGQPTPIPTAVVVIPACKHLGCSERNAAVHRVSYPSRRPRAAHPLPSTSWGHDPPVGPAGARDSDNSGTRGNSKTRASETGAQVLGGVTYMTLDASLFTHRTWGTVSTSKDQPEVDASASTHKALLSTELCSLN